MRRRSAVWAVLLVCAVAVTRFVCRSHYLYDIDSVDFGLALKHFDPAVFQPHPPGYFLYIQLGRLVNAVVNDPNEALVAISIAASCGAAGMIYLLTASWYGGGPALAAIVLFLASPLCWFHGTVALIYIVEAFFSALVGYLCWRLYSGQTRNALPATIALAIATGFRPSTAMFLGPLWVASIRRTHGLRRWLAVPVLAAGILAWAIPMVRLSGGAAAYFSSLSHLWWMVPAKRTALSDPMLAIARALTILWIFVLCFGAAAPWAFRRGSNAGPSESDRTRFTWIWLLPGLLFFTFVFLNYVNSGYLLVLSPPVFASLAFRLYEFAQSRGRRLMRWSVVGAGLAANCAFFALAPVYCSYKSVREFERDMASIGDGVRKSIDPQTTLLIGFDSHFQGYRHAGYYLPAFVTVQYPEVAYPDGNRVFMMHGGDTQLVRRLPIDRFSRFVFFPMPAGPDYAAYLEKVRAKLPADTLSSITIGRQSVLTGPASAISLLFSSTAQTSPAVYTPLHQTR